MKERELSIKEFKDALQSLKDGVHDVRDTLGQDGVVKRFEFTFELFWKTIKILLESEGIKCNSPKACIKEAFKHGELLEMDDVYIAMLNDRNLTAHVYNKLMSSGIFNRIKDIYLQKFISFDKKLDEYIAKISI